MGGSVVGVVGWSVTQSICLSGRHTVIQSNCLSLSVCLSVSQFVSLSVSPSVCLSVSQSFRQLLSQSLSQ